MKIYKKEEKYFKEKKEELLKIIKDKLDYYPYYPISLKDELVNEKLDEIDKIIELDKDIVFIRDKIFNKYHDIYNKKTIKSLVKKIILNVEEIDVLKYLNNFLSELYKLSIEKKGYIKIQQARVKYYVKMDIDKALDFAELLQDKIRLIYNDMNSLDNLSFGKELKNKLKKISYSFEEEEVFVRKKTDWLKGLFNLYFKEIDKNTEVDKLLKIKDRILSLYKREISMIGDKKLDTDYAAFSIAQLVSEYQTPHPLKEKIIDDLFKIHGFDKTTGERLCSIQNKKSIEVNVSINAKVLYNKNDNIDNVFEAYNALLASFLKEKKDNPNTIANLCNKVNHREIYGFIVTIKDNEINKLADIKEVLDFYINLVEKINNEWIANGKKNKYVINDPEVKKALSMFNIKNVFENIPYNLLYNELSNKLINRDLRENLLLIKLVQNESNNMPSKAKKKI